MNDKETNFLAPILSAFAGFGAIAAALSPLFAQTKITKLFIDPSAAGFLAIVAFIIAILTLWIFSSRTVSLVFGGNVIDIKLLAKRRIQFVGLFLFSILVFYSLQLAHKAGNISLSWGSMLQAIFYLLAFFALTAVIGMQFRDSYEQYRWQSDEDSRPMKIRQKLIDGDHVKVNLKILSIETLNAGQNTPQNWRSAYFVLYEADGQQYTAIVDSRTGNILRSNGVDTMQQTADTGNSTLTDQNEVDKSSKA